MLKPVKIGKYLEACKLPPVARRKTDQWDIRSVSGSLQGRVYYEGRWDQYEFKPAVITTFNAECLTDLARFLKDENDGNSDD